MLETLLSTSESMPVSIASLVFGLVMALILGTLISLVHTKSSLTSNILDNFSITLIMLPAVIAMIIMLIGSDIARAFSLAGAFSIIRFRSAPGNPKDITFVLLSMATGLAVGTGSTLYAVIFDILLCLILYLLSHVKNRISAPQKQKLVITIPEDMDYSESFNDILKKYTLNHTMIGVKTAALGSLYQITYDVVLINSNLSKEMIDSIRIRNSNLNISLTLQLNDAELS